MKNHIPIHYFSDIPNNEEGAEFIRLARKFLNRKRYKMRKLGRGTRKVNGEKYSYRYSASLPHQFSERFSLYIDDVIQSLLEILSNENELRHNRLMETTKENKKLENEIQYLKEQINILNK